MFIGLLILLNALFLSGLAGYISILGMTALFPGGGLIIPLMMGAMEAGKIVASVWLHANWSNPKVSWVMRTYLFSAVAVLMLITALGSFGLLSKSHLDQEAPLAGVDIKIAQIQQRIDQTQVDRKRDNDRLGQLDAQITTMLTVSKNAKDANGVTKAQAAQKKERVQLQADMLAKDTTINGLSDQLVPLKLKVSNVSADLGPLKYVVKFLGWKDQDSAVQMIIMFIISVFDPLAIALILASSISFKHAGDARREKAAAKLAARKALLPPVVAPVLEVTPAPAPAPAPAAPVVEPIAPVADGPSQFETMAEEFDKTLKAQNDRFDQLAAEFLKYNEAASRDDDIAPAVVEPELPIVEPVEPVESVESVESVEPTDIAVETETPRVAYPVFSELEPLLSISNVSQISQAPLLPAVVEGSSIYGGVGLPAGLTVSLSAPVDTYPSQNSMTATVASPGASWGIGEIGAFGGYRPKSDKEQLMDILERNQGLLEDVVASVQETDDKSVAATPPQGEPAKSWLDQPWFKQDTK